jgi:hypothetical protein
VSGVALGFLPKPLVVHIDHLLPSRMLPRGGMNSKKFLQIRASIEELDLIEPLSITPIDRATGHHTVLDGHVRLVAMRALGRMEIPCLIATDDESFTYNNRINPLSTVQQHMMIRRAVDRGVSPARLAKILGVSESQILDRMNMLDGICREVIEMLRDRRFSIELSKILRRMIPLRQVECVELMLSANNLTVAYARALQSVSTPDQLVGRAKQKRKNNGVTQEQMAKMEREISNVQTQYKLAEQSYGEDMLNFVLTRGYVSKLLENSRVLRFLEQRHADVVAQFKILVQTASQEL